MSIIDEELAKAFIDDPDNVDLSEATEITDEAAEILGQCNARDLHVDGLKRLSVVAAGALSKFKGKKLHLNGLCDVSDDVIKALAGKKAGLDLSSLCAISDDVLELLVRGRRKFLSLGLQQLSEEQAKILEFFHGKNLALDSVGEISDTVAESLAGLSVKRLSLGGLHEFSESVAERLGSLAAKELTLPGALRISRAALEKLFGAHFRDGSSELLLTGKILLPDYAPEYPGQIDAYERVYTESVINGIRMREWLAEDPKYRYPSIDGRVLTLLAAELLGSSGAAEVYFSWLQELPDNVAEALEKHTGDLTLEIVSLTPFAARCLAQRKFRKNTPWCLRLILDRLETAEAAELARTRYPLEIHMRGASIHINPTVWTAEQVNSISDGAAEALSNYEGDSLVIGVSQLSDAAAKSLSGYKGQALNLPYLTELSDVAAESLAKHKGELHLASFGDLTELSDAAVESLSKHQGKINHQNPKRWAGSLKPGNMEFFALPLN
jgi:hypothetical protein